MNFTDIKKGSNTENERGLLILLSFTLFMGLAFDMLMPLVLAHFVGNLNFIATKVALALAVRKFSQQGLAMVGGYLADRKDIKKLIALGMFLRVFGYASLGFADTFPKLVFSMIFIGLGGVVFETPYQTAIATLTDDSNRTKYYSINNTILSLGSTLGPLLGAFLIRYDFKIVCFVSAFFCLINFFITLFALPSIKKTAAPISVANSFKLLSDDKRYLKFTCMMILFWLVASQIDISYPLRIKEITGSTESVAYMYAIYASFTALFQIPVVNILSKRFSPIDIILMGISLISVSVFSVQFVNNSTMFLINVVVYTFGMLMARPNIQNTSVNLANKSATGFYLGFSYMGFAIGSGVGNIISGYLYDFSKAHGYLHLPWLIYSLFGITAFMAFAKMKRDELTPKDVRV